MTSAEIALWRQYARVEVALAPNDRNAVAILALCDALEADRNELAALRSHQNERWNVEPSGDGLLVCRNHHEKGQKCEYEYFVPAQQVDAETAALKDANMRLLVDTMRLRDVETNLARVLAVIRETADLLAEEIECDCPPEWARCAPCRARLRLRAVTAVERVKNPMTEETGRLRALLSEVYEAQPAACIGASAAYAGAGPCEQCLWCRVRAALRAGDAS